MIITILTTIIIILLAALLGMLWKAMNTHIDHLEEVDAKTITAITTVNERLNETIKAEASNHVSLNTDIEQIVAKLEAITADIHRLDEEVQRVDHDEKEIRSYYVNFREPVYEFTNGGVPWNEIYTADDDEEGEIND